MVAGSHSDQSGGKLIFDRVTSCSFGFSQEQSAIYAGTECCQSDVIPYVDPGRPEIMQFYSMVFYEYPMDDWMRVFFFLLYNPKHRPK